MSTVSSARTPSSRRWRRVATLVAAGLLATPLAASAVPAEPSDPEPPAEPTSVEAARGNQPAYRVQELARPAGLAAASPDRVVVNGTGEALVSQGLSQDPARSCYIAGTRRARWVPVPAESLVGGPITRMECADLADDGTVVGTVAVNYETVAIAWLRGSTPVRLANPPGTWTVSAGSATTWGSRFGGHAWGQDGGLMVRWDRRGQIDAVSEAETFFLNDGLEVTGLSDAGMLTGSVGYGHGETSGWLWDGTTPTRLRTLQDRSRSEPLAISADGRFVVGVASDGNPHGPQVPPTAVSFAADGSVRELPDGVNFRPAAVNNRERIVGVVGDGQSPYRAALWWRGQRYDLDAVTSRLAGRRVLGATSINAAGDIGAVAVGPDGSLQPVLLDARR